MLPMEFERKFLVREVPKNFKTYQRCEIKQRYIGVLNYNTDIKLGAEGNKFYISILPPDLDRTSIMITPEQYEALGACPADIGSLELRTRIIDDKEFYFTMKSKGNESRAEFEIGISHHQFSEFWKIARVGMVIEKFRYSLPHVEEVRSAVLDIHIGRLEGLVTAETEFNSLNSLNRFQPLDWFGREITDDTGYKNIMLATQGIPKNHRYLFVKM